MKDMQILFLGTGAADHHFDQYGSSSEVRGSCSTLINGKILIDAGPTGYAGLKRFGISPNDLSALLITHDHADHCSLENILRIQLERDKTLEPLKIYLPPLAMKKYSAEINKSDALLIPLDEGMSFTLDDFTITPLPANHQVPSGDQCFWFLMESAAGNLLYALDGAWFRTKSAKLIGAKPLSWIIWDATMLEAGDWRSFEHNDLQMIKMQIAALKNCKCVTEKTVHILDHMARTLWPNPAESTAIAQQNGFIMAYDGLLLEY